MDPRTDHDDFITDEPPAAPRFVLLHASGGSARQWQALAATLAATLATTHAGRGSVHAIDLHGHGARAEWNAARPLTLADEAALAAPLLADGGPVHLVGHSYGAAVALKLATLHPQAVASVAVYEPVLFGLLFDADPFQGASREIVAVAETVHARVQAGDTAGAAAVFVDYWGGPGAFDRLGERGAAAMASRMRAVGRHFGALFGDALDADALHSLRMPLLVLSGDATPSSTRRIASLLRGALPYARHEALAGMGHLGPLTHAERVNERIVAFLRGLVDTGAPATRP